MHKKGKPVFRMTKGGDVTKMSRTELEDYISKNYLPHLSKARMYFSFYETGYDYYLLGDSKLQRNALLKYYTDNSDFTESSLAENSNYKITDGWEIVEVIKDPETDEIIEERELELIAQDNTYNFTYLGLIDLNWRVYYDDVNEHYFYVIHPHIGGDIRGNYGDALILKGDDKEELFYRYYYNFISGRATIYFEFKDESNLVFDSENDSDVFAFEFIEENSEINSKIAQHLVDDFQKFTGYAGDEFLQQIVEEFSTENNPKFVGGGDVGTPMAYIEILGYNDGQWMDLSVYDSGEEFMDAISEYMAELNKIDGGDREEYRVADFEGFGDGDYYEYMGESEFDNIIQGYKEYENSNFPIEVIEEYKTDTGIDDYSDTIRSMNDNFIGEYDDYEDYGYQLVQDGSFEVTDSYIYITDTDKRLLAGEEADFRAEDMSFEDLLEIATETNNDYEKEKEDLESRIEELQEELSDLEALYDVQEEENDYQQTMELIGEKQMLIEEIEEKINDLEESYFSRAKSEASEIFYDEIYDKLDRDLSSWLDENGYTENLADVSFLSVDYEEIGKDLAGDYLVIENNRNIYVFSTYVGGGKAIKMKNKEFPFFIVEEKNKKIISGYATKEDAIKNKGNLVRQYKGLKFNIYEKNALSKKTNLNPNMKGDYMNLSDLESASKIATEPSKLKVVGYKAKSGAKKGLKYIQEQWQDLDFGDGKGGAKFDNGGTADREQMMNDLRKKYERIETGIRFKLATILGIDEAINYMDGYSENVVHPYDLIRSAIVKEFITIDEINKEIINESIYESDDITSTYKGSGQGIGSSDMNVFIYNMLKSAGVPLGIVNGRYERLDKMPIIEEPIEEVIEEPIEEVIEEPIEQTMEELMGNHRIILSPSGNFMIVNENQEIVKENGNTIYFGSKSEAENYVIDNLSNSNKASVGAVLMAVDLAQKQQQAQAEAQAKAQAEAEARAIQEQQELEREATSTEIITDDTIEVNMPTN